MIYNFFFQTAFDPWFITFYNLMYTALPVIALAVFDRDVNDVNSLTYPKLYTAGHNDTMFNKKKFFEVRIYSFCRCRNRLQLFSLYSA